MRKHGGQPSVVPYAVPMAFLSFSFRHEWCFYAPRVYFSRALTCIFTFGSNRQMGACTSPKHHPTALHLWACFRSLFKLSHASLVSLNIYTRQQWFWLRLTRSYAFAASVRLFAFVPVLLAECAPTLPPASVVSKPFPHSHHKQFF